MNTAWKKALKWAAGKAFTWGLKILTEKYGEGKPLPKPLQKKTQHRKPYVN